MKKRKSEKDQSINKLKKRVKDLPQTNDKEESENDFNIHYMVTDTLDKLFLNLLIDRLQECIKAQSEYNDIRSHEQILMDGNRKIICDRDNKTGDAMSRTEFNTSMDMLTILPQDAMSNIHDKQSLSILLFCCLVINNIDVYHLNFRATRDDIITYHVNKCYAMNKSYEALGYWQPKAKQGEINQKNVQIRSKEKEARKAMMQEWLKTMTRNQCRRKALLELGVEDRTIQTYLHEILDKEKESEK